MSFRLGFPAKAPRPRPILWTTSALVILALVVPGMVTAQINCDVSMTDLAVSNGELQLMAAINTYRASLGIAPLAWSPVLTRPTAWMAVDLATRSDRVFSHTDSLGRPPFTSGGSGGRVFDCGQALAPSLYLGENIAGGYASTDSTFLQWRNSPGHDEIMKSPNFRSGAIGHRYLATSAYGHYWVLNTSSESGVALPTVTPRPTMTPVRSPTPPPGPTQYPLPTAVPTPTDEQREWKHYVCPRPLWWNPALNTEFWAQCMPDRP